MSTAIGGLGVVTPAPEMRRAASVSLSYLSLDSSETIGQVESLTIMILDPNSLVECISSGPLYRHSIGRDVRVFFEDIVRTDDELIKLSCSSSDEARFSQGWTGAILV